MTDVAQSTRTWAERTGLKVRYADVTGSTNDDAKADADASDRLYLARHQSAGRGRGTNRWDDVGAGRILLSTWTFKVPSAPQAITGPRVGLALHRAATKGWPRLPWSLKAPNDLYLGEKKIAGLLLEVVSAGGQPRLIVGLGFNVLSHPHTVTTATDLAQLRDGSITETEWSVFLDAWLSELRLALTEIVVPTLDPGVRRELRLALNARANAKFIVDDVSAEGDLVHAGAIVRWTEL